jgi:hypothetical protein
LIYESLPHAREADKRVCLSRSVVLEEDESEDFASSAHRLLKLVDQDFADVTGHTPSLTDPRLCIERRLELLLIISSSS